MKKFFVCLCLVILFSGFVFYLGWVQIKVKPENVGVIISKTHGVNEKPVVPGQFYWTYQFLIPTNAILKQFTIKPVNSERTVSGVLSNGEKYSFTYAIALTVGPEAIIDLYTANKITEQEDFETYLNETADVIAQLATNYILDKIQGNSFYRPESLRRDDFFRSVMIYKEFPELELSVFAVKESVIPDFNKISQNQINYNETFYNTENENESQEKDDILDDNSFDDDSFGD